MKTLAELDPHTFIAIVGPAGMPADVVTKLNEAMLDLPKIGDDFLGFSLLAELGKGAFGKVFLAQQGQLAGRLVALKIAAAKMNIGTARSGVESSALRSACSSAATHSLVLRVEKISCSTAVISTRFSTRLPLLAKRGSVARSGRFIMVHSF
mgnify:CR=1 FL=1